MIKNVSEEEILLRKRARRRFIGAVTFVILSVVFLPMILDDAPQQEQEQIDIQLPSEELTTETYPWMTPENAPATDEAEIAPDPDKPLPFSDSEYSGKIESGRPGSGSMSGIPVPARKPPFAKSAPVSDPAPFVQEKVPAGNNVKAQEGAFVIQLGAFSDVSKAKQQQQNLVANGIRAYTETIKVGNSEMTRVRIGPFATREAAEAEHERLKKTGLSGVVTTK